MSATVGHRPVASGLRNRPYRALLGAVVISEMGDWLLFIALPLYALHSSGSALATSTVFLAELAPAVLIGTACGPLIDRLNRRHLLVGLTVAQAGLLLPLLAAEPHRLWLIYLVAALQAGIASITRPAQQALVPALVARDGRARANALVEMASNAARLAGSPLGGLLLPVLHLEGLVLADAASFLIGATLLSRAAAGTEPEPVCDASTSRAGAIREGWHAVRRDMTLLSALLISFVGAVAQGLFLVLFVLFVLRLLHAGDAAVGLLRGVQAIGGVLGGVVVGVWASRVGTRILAAGGLAAFGLISLLAWNSPAVTSAIWWYGALFIVVGIPATALNTGLITGAQDASHPSMRGRVLSLMGVADALGQGSGIVAAGLLAGSVSLTALLNAQASCYLACAAIAAAGFARQRA
jgi:predicted MFS family arabinose efflux permease